MSRCNYYGNDKWCNQIYFNQNTKHFCIFCYAVWSYTLRCHSNIGPHIIPTVIKLLSFLANIFKILYSECFNISLSIWQLLFTVNNYQMNTDGHNSMTYQDFDTTLDIILLVIFLSNFVYFVRDLLKIDIWFLFFDWTFFKLTTFCDLYYQCYTYKMFYCSNLKRNISKYFQYSHYGILLFSIWYFFYQHEELLK